MRLADIFAEYDAETMYKILKKLDDSGTSPGNRLVKCPEIVYTTESYTDISMENMEAAVPVPLRGSHAGKSIDIDLAYMRMFESEDTYSSGLTFADDKVIYSRESLNATFMGMQYISDLFLRGITPHVPIVLEASRCFDESKIPMDVIYLELVRTRFRNGPSTRTLREILSPEFEDKIPGLHSAKVEEIMPLALKIQVAATLDLLDSYDIYVGDIDMDAILVSRFRKRPTFRYEIMDNFGFIEYMLSDGTAVSIPNLRYFIRIADIHTFAIGGKLVYDKFIDGSEGGESSEYASDAEGHAKHVSSHIYTTLRTMLFDGDVRTWAEITKDLHAKLEALPPIQRSGKVLRIKSLRRTAESA